jgi:hypothetical protein
MDLIDTFSKSTGAKRAEDIRFLGQGCAKGGG